MHNVFKYLTKQVNKKVFMQICKYCIKSVNKSTQSMTQQMYKNKTT